MAMESNFKLNSMLNYEILLSIFTHAVQKLQKTYKMSLPKLYKMWILCD
jgi:hypothetical protein